ncbi:MAG: hypothetical protein H6R10_1070 [Rhodocyclaceae bacterium]|nr:hypothetical protein [Rhodocyclaceae bacterium]
MDLKTQFSEGQIIGLPKQAEIDVLVKDLCPYNHWLTLTTVILIVQEPLQNTG